MSYPANSIANLILDEAKEQGLSISPMKLQKLVYYAHGWWSAVKDQPLLDEAIQAWQYGPVIQSIYNQFRSYGSGLIGDGRACRWVSDPKEIIKAVPVEPPEDKEVRSLIGFVLRSYGQKSALELSAMTHAPDSPWSAAWAASGGAKNAVIPESSIREFFKKQLYEMQKPAAAVQA